MLAPLLAGGCAEQTQRLNDLEDIRQQSVSQRVFRDLAILSVDTLRYEFGTVGQARYDDNGNLYILDRFIQAIVKFDSASRFVAELGKKGPGPGEFQRISAFDVRGDGIVAVADGGRITIFDNTGSYVTSRAPGSIHSMLAVNGQSIVSGHSFASPAFRALSDNLTTLFQFGRFGADIQVTSAQILGTVDGYSGGTILVTQFTGLILGFDISGERVFATKTIDAPDSKEVRWENGALKTAGYSSMLTNVTEEHIYLVSTSAQPENIEEWFIDVYSTQDGGYVHSFVIPHASCGPRYIGDNEMMSGCMDGEVLRTKFVVD